jgi:cation:H+ antiporter
MIENLFIFFVSLFFIIKGATLSTKYSFKIAESYNVSKYVVGFFVVAIISIIPETLVSINAALQNVPAMGLGALFGSNIADLTLIFAIAVLLAGRSLKVESKILKANAVYPFILLIPIALGIDGFYSRWEGLALIFAGIVFYALSFKREQRARPAVIEEKKVNTNKKLDFVYLIIGLVLLLAGSHFVVTSGIEIATLLNLNKAAMGMLFIGLGTTMPELFFCISAVKNNHDSLAIGDVLGTVLADATIVIGILAMVSPFAFPRKIIYIAGLFMVAAAFILFYMMKTGKNLTRSEAILLIFFWVLFVSTELILNS